MYTYYIHNNMKFLLNNFLKINESQLLSKIKRYEKILKK